MKPSSVLTPPAETVIPVYKPHLVGRESEYVNECLASGWISSRGEFVSRFEHAFAAYLNVAHATTVANGTVALHLALRVLDIGPGDEVIVPTFTYIASVNAIAMTGATPVFADSLEDSWNLDPREIEACITPKTKAVLGVHLYGGPCDLDAISNICKTNGLFFVEDAAEAFGSKYHDRHVGAFGDISTFSFFGNKTITTGEGGMLVSNSESLVGRAAFLKSQAVSRTREYWHDDIGYNYRMTNICAAIGLAQLEQADRIIHKKREIASWYKEELRDQPLLFQADAPGTFNSFWMVSVVAHDRATRDRLRATLAGHGVETRPFFYPAHKMPVFHSERSFPVAESLSERGLNLPSYPDLTREQVAHVSTLIARCLQARS